MARRHDPALRRPDRWGRPVGWARFDLRRAPDIGFDTKEGEGAVVVNGLRPFARLPIRPEIESLNVSNAAAVALYELAREQ